MKEAQFVKFIVFNLIFKAVFIGHHRRRHLCTNWSSIHHILNKWGGADWPISLTNLHWSLPRFKSQWQKKCFFKKKHAKGQNRAQDLKENTHCREKYDCTTDLQFTISSFTIYKYWNINIFSLHTRDKIRSNCRLASAQ